MARLSLNAIYVQVYVLFTTYMLQSAFTSPTAPPPTSLVVFSSKSLDIRIEGEHTQDQESRS
jgi:hypothetical protein